MADGSFDDFDSEEDFDLDLEQDLAHDKPSKRSRKGGVAPVSSPRDLAVEVALTLPTDRDALLRIGEQALIAYDDAIRRDRPKAADEARTLFGAAVYRLNGDTFFASYGGPEAAGYILANYGAAPPGQPMRWAQKGVMRVETDGMIAALECGGGFSLGLAYSWHAIDLDAPFFSNTGYLSYLSAPIIWGASLEEAAVIWMRALIKAERKVAPVPPDAWIRKGGPKYPFLAKPGAGSAPSGLMAFPF